MTVYQSQSAPTRRYAWLMGEGFSVARVSEAAAECTQAESAGGPVGAVVVAPTHVATALSAVPEGVSVVSVAGYPTGRHHGLVKAAEARLAVQTGAGEVWASVDATIEGVNELLPDLIALREACPEPVELGLIVPEANAQAAAEAAALAGFQRLILQEGQELVSSLDTVTQA